MQRNHSPDKHAPDKEERREDALDETIAESFPASDPPSTLPNPDNDEKPEETKETDRDRT